MVPEAARISASDSGRLPCSSAIRRPGRIARPMMARRTAARCARELPRPPAPSVCRARPIPLISRSGGSRGSRYASRKQPLTLSSIDQLLGKPRRHHHALGIARVAQQALRNLRRHVRVARPQRHRAARERCVKRGRDHAHAGAECAAADAADKIKEQIARRATFEAGGKSQAGDGVVPVGMRQARFRIERHGEMQERMVLVVPADARGDQRPMRCPAFATLPQGRCRERSSSAAELIAPAQTTTSDADSETISAVALGYRRRTRGRPRSAGCARACRS